MFNHSRSDLADFSTENNAETCLLVVFPHHNHTSADGLPLNVLRTPNYIEELATEYMEDYMKYSSGAMAIEDDMLNPASFCKDIITEHHAQSLGERFLERWRYCQMNVTHRDTESKLSALILSHVSAPFGPPRGKFLWLQMDP